MLDSWRRLPVYVQIHLCDSIAPAHFGFSACGYVRREQNPEHSRYVEWPRDELQCVARLVEDREEICGFARAEHRHGIGQPDLLSACPAGSIPGACHIFESVLAIACDVLSSP